MLYSSSKYFFSQNFLQNCSKTCSTFNTNFSTLHKNSRQIPKCIYVLPPAQWLKNKINFQRIKVLDKDFNEKQFKIGAKQVSLVLLELARSRDSARLANISTLRGFSRIYRDMITSDKDPRRKLLFFNSEDIQKIVPTDVQIVESQNKYFCLIEVFFVGLKYLDDVVDCYKKSEPNSNLQIYQNLKNVERMLNKKDFAERMQIPLSEKLLVTEGYFHLFTTFSSDPKERSWKVDFFKISEFNIVHFKGD